MKTDKVIKRTVKRSHLEIPSVTFQETTWGEDFGLGIWGATIMNLSDTPEQIVRLPKADAEPFLQLNTDIEFQLLCLRIARDRTPVPSPHYIFVLEAIVAIWFLRKNRELQELPREIAANHF
jgi:hypothetical protein